MEFFLLKKSLQKILTEKKQYYICNDFLKRIF